MTARPFAFACALMGAAMLSGCASLPDEGFTPIARAETPAFDPIAFFTGPTEGRGALDKGVFGTVPLRVESFGEVELNGTLILTQDIYEGDKEVRTRTLELRQTGEGSYAGRMSDSISPMKVWAKGNTLTMTWRMEGNYDVTQVLTLADDGSRATNTMRVDLLGTKVAVGWEEIERVE